MGIGVSVFLIAVGAVLFWAVTGDVQGIDLEVIGLILMIAGAIGLLWTLVASTALPRRRNVIVEDDERVVRR